MVSPGIATASSSAVTASLELPWVEKYRPRVLEDVVGNQTVLDRLSLIARKGDMPHLMLVGPPGIGKTTSIACIARSMLGAKASDAVLELNASDERGIDVIRNKVKAFARWKVRLPPGLHKIIILDEADSMTPMAQQALRRTMELYTIDTRFALACNTSSKIIEAIQSRCAVLRFGRISDDQARARLIQIIGAEGIECDTEGIDAVVFTADGDMRQAINNLQSTVSGFGSVTEANVYKVCDQPAPKAVRAIIRATLDGEVHSALKGVKSLYNQGFAVVDIMTTISRIVRSFQDMEENRRMEMAKEIAATHARVSKGTQSLLQLYGMISRIMLPMEPSAMRLRPTFP